jgi:hypothetical protein
VTIIFEQIEVRYVDRMHAYCLAKYGQRFWDVICRNVNDAPDHTKSPEEYVDYLWDSYQDWLSKDY